VALCFLIVIMGSMQWTRGFSALQCTHWVPKKETVANSKKNSSITSNWKFLACSMLRDDTPWMPTRYRQGKAIPASVAVKKVQLKRKYSFFAPSTLKSTNFQSWPRHLLIATDILKRWNSFGETLPLGGVLRSPLASYDLATAFYGLGSVTVW